MSDLVSTVMDVRENLQWLSGILRHAASEEVLIRLDTCWHLTNNMLDSIKEESDGAHT